MIVSLALGSNYGLLWFGFTDDEASPVVSALIFLGWPLYTASATALTNGQTLGKKIVAIRVVRVDGKAVGFGWSLLRDSLCRILPSLIPLVGTFLNYLWPLWDGRKQSLHDKLAQTVVVREPNYKGRGWTAPVAALVGIGAWSLGAWALGEFGEYNDRERRAFVASCAEGGGSTARCECAFDRIKQTLPYADYTEAERRLAENPDASVPSELTRAFEGCS